MLDVKSPVISRRSFLAATGLATLGARALHASDSRVPRLLLRSSWQTINIGDIAHTPGVLQLLRAHLPEVQVTLWPSRVDNGVRELLLEHFPELTIATSRAAIDRAFEECDFMLHGSSAELSAAHHLVQWHEQTGKPYGVYGITFGPQKSWMTAPTPEEELMETVAVLSRARFVYFRDSVSLAFAKEKGCTSPVMAFGPDGAFACDLRDGARADVFLQEHGLEPGQFLCCIPRYRYTPGWMLPGREDAFDSVKHARNEEMKEHDHAPLRAAITAVIRETPMKVLICPEDQTQMAIGKKILYNRLPKAVRERVVWRPDYWLTGEAVSTYRRSAGLFGNELHSAIMCIGQGVPAIVCRWEEQTSKGTMWRDIGLADWLFDVDDARRMETLVPTVLGLVQSPEEARRRVARAQAIVRERQQVTMTQLGRELASVT